jgi:ribosomal protein S7
MSKTSKSNQVYYKDFYKSLDGFYGSYWIGKFTNSFVQKGQKHTVEKELAKSFIFTKLRLNSLTLHILLINFEKIKPTFKLKSVTVAGKKRDFPVFLPPEKQRNRAIKNFKAVIENRKEWYLNQRILNELIDLRVVPNHELFKQRNESLREAMKNRFNIRFGY